MIQHCYGINLDVVEVVQIYLLPNNGAFDIVLRLELDSISVKEAISPFTNISKNVILQAKIPSRIAKRRSTKCIFSVEKRFSNNNHKIE